MLSLALGVWLKYQLRIPDFRHRFHEWCLSAPAIGRYLTAVDTVRTCRTLAVLMTNGTGLTDSLALASDTVSNEAFASRLRAVNDEVKAGRRLSEACDRHHCFPSQAIQMIKVGEETGELSQMLDKVVSRRPI